MEDLVGEHFHCGAHLVVCVRVIDAASLEVRWIGWERPNWVAKLSELARVERRRRRPATVPRVEGEKKRRRGGSSSSRAGASSEGGARSSETKAAKRPRRSIEDDAATSTIVRPAAAAAVAGVEPVAAAEAPEEGEEEEAVVDASDDEEGLCAICFEESTLGNLVVIRPCGHNLYCRTCATQVATCPACRRRITKLDGGGLCGAVDEGQATTQEGGAAAAAVTAAAHKPAALLQVSIDSFFFSCGGGGRGGAPTRTIVRDPKKPPKPTLLDLARASVLRPGVAVIHVRGYPQIRGDVVLAGGSHVQLVLPARDGRPRTVHPNPSAFAAAVRRDGKAAGTGWQSVLYHQQQDGPPTSLGALRNVLLRRR